QPSAVAEYLVSEEFSDRSSDNRSGCFAGYFIPAGLFHQQACISALAAPWLSVIYRVLYRLVLPGSAVGCQRTDLCSFTDAGLPLGIIPQRSGYIYSLGIYRSHHFALGTGSILWLAVSVWCSAGAD